MNRPAAYAALISLFAVLTAAVQEIGDARWRALASVVALVVVWLVGLHSPQPHAASSGNTATAHTPSLPSTTNGAAPTDFAEMVEEFRGMRDSFERLIEVQTRDMAEHAKFRDRFEALERTRAGPS